MLLSNGDTIFFENEGECEQPVERFNVSGDSIWKRFFSLNSCMACVLQSVHYSNGNGISMIWNESFEGSFSQTIARVSTEGELIWELPVPRNRYVNAFSELTDGTVVLVGSTCGSEEKGKDNRS